MPEADSIFLLYPDLKRLQTSLQLAGTEFSLFFVECNLPGLRNQLADELAEEMTPRPLRVDVSLLHSDTVPLDELIAAQVADTQGAVFLFGLEQWLPALSQDKLLSTVRQLNWRRNRFAALQRPLVIWLPRYALNILAEHTPDFYDWYSGVFVFQPTDEQQSQAEGRSLQALWSDSRVHAADRLSFDEKKRWLHTLQELLQGHAAADLGRADLLANIARLMDSMGDYTQALDYNQQALAIRQKIGDQAGLCFSLFNTGHIQWKNGDRDKAMQTWRQAYEIAKQINLAQGLEALEKLAAELDLPGGLAGWEAMAKREQQS